MPTQQQKDTHRPRASLRMRNSLQPAASRSHWAQTLSPILQAQGQPGLPVPALALHSRWAAGGTREGPPTPLLPSPALPHGCAIQPRPGGWPSPGLECSRPTSAAPGEPHSATPPPALGMQPSARTLGLRGSGDPSPLQGLSSAPALCHPPRPAQPPRVPQAEVGASAVREDPLAGTKPPQVSAPCSALSLRVAARGGRRLPAAGPGCRGPCERPKCHQDDPTANGTSHHGDSRDKAPR